MSAIRVTITAYAQGSIADDLGLEPQATGASWVSSPTGFGLTTTFVVTGATWTRLRPKLAQLSLRRIPAYNTSTGVPLGKGKTMPYMTYTVEWVPAGRPRIHQIEGGPLSLAAPANVTLRGTGFLGSTNAYAIIQQATTGYIDRLPGTRTVPRTVEVFRVTSVLAGPIGNRVSLTISPASGAGAVFVTPDTSTDEGGVNIRVVPAAGASNTTAIAAQINGDAVASTFITATATVASIALSPTIVNPLTGPVGGGNREMASVAVLKDKLRLSQGDGSAPASASFFVTAGAYANRLRVVSARAGNDRNIISLTVNMAQGSNTVVVTGTDIVVNRTGATETIANLVTAINGSAQAAALVTASAVGAGSLGAQDKTWLEGGAGEPVIATIAGAPARVVSQTDTAIVLAVTNPDLVAAGVSVGEIAVIQLLMHYGLATATMGAVAA